MTTSSVKFKKITVIILRHMFLPPMLENFSDIAIVLAQNSISITQSSFTVDAREIADSIHLVKLNQPIY